MINLPTCVPVCTISKEIMSLILLILNKIQFLIHYFVISYYIKIFLGLNAKLFFKEYKSNKKKILYFNFKYNKFIKLALLAFHNNISIFIVIYINRVT